MSVIAATSLSASSPTLCPAALMLESNVVTVAAVLSSGREGSQNMALGITVIDRDATLKLNPYLNAGGVGGMQPVRVSVVSSRIDEPSDIITLQQANESEGTFTGVINISSVIPGAENDGIVRLEPGNTLQVIYTPVLYLLPRSTVVQKVRTWVNSSLRLLPLPAAAVGPVSNRQVRDTSAIQLGGVLTIEVADADQDENTSKAGTSTTPCSSLSCTFGSSVTVFFQGYCAQKTRVHAIHSGLPGHALHAHSPKRASQFVLLTKIFAHVGITEEKIEVYANVPFFLILTARLITHADHVAVELSMRNGSSLVKSLLLRETGLSTGVFTAQVSHPGLEAAARGAIPSIITYLDINENGIMQPVISRAAFAVPGELTCSSITSSAGTFGESDTLTVTVVDADLDQLSDHPDVTGMGTISDALRPAVIVYGHDGDVEAIAVTETKHSSGIFTGIVLN